MTSKGKPNTIIKDGSDRGIENDLLVYNPKFLSSLQKAKEEYLKLGGLSINDYLGKRRT